MPFESYSGKVSGYGFVAGLIIGQLMGIVISTVSQIDLVSGITNGAGAGIIIAMIPAYVLINEKLSDRKMIVPFAMGWGTLVGILVGLSSSWAQELAYMCGFSYGAVGGLATGVIIGLFLWKIPEDS